MRSDRNIENDQIKKPEGHTCKKMQKEDLLLYAVTDRHWLNGETLYLSLIHISEPTRPY